MTVEPAVNTTQILVGMMPELPVLPEWPSPKLNYDPACGHYYLSETDVDLILDYCENKILQYKYELEVYNKQLNLIKSSL